MSIAFIQVKLFRKGEMTKLMAFYLEEELI